MIERSVRTELIPLIAHHAKRGSVIISDECQAYRHALPQLGYRHYTVNHSVVFVDAQTGAHSQYLERAWRTYKETVWKLRGNRTKELLVNHLAVIEWLEWLVKGNHSGPLGHLIHDIAKLYR